MQGRVDFARMLCVGFIQTARYLVSPAPIQERLQRDANELAAGDAKLLGRGLDLLEEAIRDRTVALKLISQLGQTLASAPSALLPTSPGRVEYHPLSYPQYNRG